MPMTWTVLETFWSIEEAQIARGFLESEGIACQLENLAIAGNLWHLNNATGGVKLLVETEKVELAGRLLAEAEEAHQKRESSRGDSDDEFDGDREDYGVDEDEPNEDVTSELAAQASGRDESESDDVADHHGLFDKMQIGKQIILFTFLLPLVGFMLFGFISLLLSIVGAG